jgi:hypothetical protein
MAMRDHFLKKYAAEYLPPKQEENAPMLPEHCETLKQLHAWKAAKVWSVKQYVPKEHQGMPLKNVEADFQKNKMRLQQAMKAKEDEAEEKKEAKAAPAAKAAVESTEKAPQAKESPAELDSAKSLRGTAAAQTPEAVSLVAEVPASLPILAIFAAAALPAVGVVAFLQKFKYFGSREMDQPLLLSA